MSGSNSDFLMQPGSGGVYNFSSIPFQLKDTFLTKSGLKIWEFYVDSTLSRTIYYGLPGYDYINFQGKLLENVSDKSYNYYVGNDKWSYYYGQYKSSSRYLGTGQKEAIWLYPNGWGKDQVNFISGAGNNDIAIIPQKINDITSLVTNSLGFTRLETFYAVYIIAGVNELHFLDTSISLNSQTPGTSAVKVVKGGYDIDNDLRSQYRSAGPGKAILTTDNSDNIVFVMHSGPGEGGKLSADHLPSYDFYKGTDTLLMPNWNSSEVNFKRVGSEWIMLGSEFSPTYSNLEYVQFKDKAIKLNSDGTIQDILFTNIGASPTPTPTPTPTPPPTYTLTPSGASINEGSTLTTSIATTNVASGTTLYYSLSGTGINSSDFSSGALTGSGSVASNGSFSFSHTIANDLTTEGTETLNIKLFSDAARTTQVGSTSTITIADTSTTLSTPAARTVDNLYAKAMIAGPLVQTNITGIQINYQFYNIGANRYGIRQKEFAKIDEITGLDSISISGTTISISQDIQGVFDQVTGRETQDAQAFRLYNAAFARFPDSGGLRYWINEYKSGISNYRTIAQSFINSNEFALRYGANNSNEEFINNMYKNVLGRLPDASGLAYWVGNLNSGADSRVNVLGGFSESAENKILFSQGTGFN